MLSNFRLSMLILTAILALVIAGCSGGGANPSTPDLPSGSNSIESGLKEPIEGLSAGLLGVYQISINPDTLKYEIVPARKLSAIGDTAIIDITKYFIANPCTDCFGIDSIGLTPENNLDVIFKMKHPFPATAGREDLTVFDVRGIMILDGNTSFSNLPFIDLDGDGFVDEAPTGDFDTLINADGYTYHYDYVAQELYGLEKNGNLNPYRLFFNENNPDPDINGNQMPWYKMVKGSPFDMKHYFLKLDQAGETLDFIFVIECFYGQSAIFGLPPEEPGSRQNPLYFNPEFNCKEAYRVDIDLTGNLVEGNTASSTTVKVSVEDWQNTTVPGWNISNSASIKYRSDVASVSLAAPDISTPIQTKTAADTGNGTRFNPYIYTFELTNANNAPFGEYTGIIAVMDQYQEDGRIIQGVTPSVKFATFTNYQAVKFIVNEAAANTPPVAIGEADPNPADHGQTVNFTDEDSYDGDTSDSISLYEWDFDYDGVTFDIDHSSSTANDASTTYENTTGSDLQKTACLRVTDQHSATDLTEVVVTVKTLPVNNDPIAVADANPNPANHGQTVNLIDTNSHDNDAGDSISLYEWDFDYDGITFDIDHSSATPNNASTSYQNTTGSDIEKTACLRVTDQHSAFDIATVVITVQTQIVNHSPVAVADANPNPVNHGQTINLIDNNSHDDDPGDSISLYEWDYDYDGITFNVDHSSSTANTASTTYSNTTGSDIEKTACLRVTDEYSEIDIATIVIIIKPLPPNNNPVAVAGANPNPVNHAQTINFIDSSSHDDDPGDSISLYEWDYDYDGVTFDVNHSSSTANTASTTYSNTTSSDIEKTACLRVTDQHSAIDIATIVITIHPQVIPNEDPIAIANANPNPVTSGRTVQLLDILSFDNDPGDSITAYKWDTDIYNGINWEYISDQPNHATHVYINEGLDPIQFTARLRVEDAHGGWDEDDITITVNPNRPPVAVCDATPNPSRGGMPVSLISSDSYDPDPTGSIILFEWDFDYDGTTFNIDSSSIHNDDVIHIYENTSGVTKVFTAALRVTDNRLTTDICTVDITVLPNNPPTPEGYVTPDPQYANVPVTFHAEGSHDDDADDSISKIEWDFNDDSVFDWNSTNPNATTTHTYTNSTGNPIQVTAVLRAYDEAGLWADVDVVFTIDPPLPIPVITHLENKTSNNTGLAYKYKSFSTSAAGINFQTGPWNFTTFGPGSTYNETFLAPGNSECSSFIGYYPDATTVFKTTSGTYTGYGPRYYQDEVWGGYQAELGQESSQGDWYSMVFYNPALIPFPMQQYYSESLFAQGDMLEGLISFTFSFDIQQVGYGLVTTELGTFNCLLMRTLTVFSMTDTEDQISLTFEWLADDGRKIATMTSSTFDNITLIPYGTIKGGRLVP
jgi:hypothetical protein